MPTCAARCAARSGPGCESGQGARYARPAYRSGSCGSRLVWTLLRWPGERRPDESGPTRSSGHACIFPCPVPRSGSCGSRLVWTLLRRSGERRPDESGPTRSSGHACIFPCPVSRVPCPALAPVGPDLSGCFSGGRAKGVQMNLDPPGAQVTRASSRVPSGTEPRLHHPHAMLPATFCTGPPPR